MVVSGTWTMAGPAMRLPGSSRSPHNTGVGAVREDVDRLVDMEEVGRGRAERRPERADTAERHDERLGAELARVDAGVHRPRAAVSEDGEVARVVALVHGDLPDEVGHLV